MEAQIYNVIFILLYFRLSIFPAQTVYVWNLGIYTGWSVGYREMAPFKEKNIQSAMSH